MFNIPNAISLDAAGTVAVVVRRGGRGAMRKGIRRLGWRRVRNGDLDALLGASERIFDMHVFHLAYRGVVRGVRTHVSRGFSDADKCVNG